MSGRATNVSEPERLALIALEQVGIQESPRGSNRGRALAKYFAADNYRPTPDEGYPWCAAYVSWCTQELLRQRRAWIGGWFEPLRTAGAWDLMAQAAQRSHCWEVIDVSMVRAGLAWPMAGDIAVYTFSHCGIVVAGASDDRAKHIFSAAEGNTDSEGGREGFEVAVRPRTWAQIRALIRMRPNTKGDQA